MCVLCKRRDSRRAKTLCIRNKRFVGYTVDKKIVVLVLDLDREWQAAGLPSLSLFLQRQVGGFDFDAKKLKKKFSGGRRRDDLGRDALDRRRNESAANSSIAAAPSCLPSRIREDACGFR